MPRLTNLKDVLFPAPSTAPATQPAADPSTQPMLKLEELLARQSGRPAAEQVEFIQRSFDAQMAQLQNLAQLHSQGILSDEEFAAAKAKALGI